MKPKGDKIEIHYDRDGRILSVVDAAGHGKISAGVAPMGGAHTMVAALTREQKEMSLLAFHAGHRVDVRGESPTLVAVDQQRGADRDVG